MKAKLLIATFDVTELTDDELDALTGEVTAQGESSKGDWGDETGHPAVTVQTTVLEVEKGEPDKHGAWRWKLFGDEA